MPGSHFCNCDAQPFQATVGRFDIFGNSYIVHYTITAGQSRTDAHTVPHAFGRRYQHGAVKKLGGNFINRHDKSFSKKQSLAWF